MAVKKKAERKFWEKIDAALAAAKAADDPPPRRFVKALASSLAGRSTNFATARRKAGVGSLGRPRWIAVADRRDDEGIVHEAKALVTSAWHLARGTPNAPVRASDAANGRYRAPDPVYRAEGGIVVRRLAPDYGKFEIDKKGEPVLAPEILRAMARDLANVHLGTGNETALRDAITADLKARSQAGSSTTRPRRRLRSSRSGGPMRPARRPKSEPLRRQPWSSPARNQLSFRTFLDGRDVMADVKTMLVLPGKRLSVVKPIKRTFQASAGVALTCALILVLVLGNGLLMSKGTTSQALSIWLAFIKRSDILATMFLTAAVTVLFVYWQRDREKEQRR